jgi:hypothetical protein
MSLSVSRIFIPRRRIGRPLRPSVPSPAIGGMDSNLKITLHQLITSTGHIFRSLSITTMKLSAFFSVLLLAGAASCAQGVMAEEPLQTSVLSTTTATSTSATPTHTLARHVPMCHRSEAVCKSSTNSCSGRGSCYLKSSSGKNSTEYQAQECWSCKCKSTAGTGSGNRTQYWGGAACQKEDVSMAFWLIAGTTIFVVAAIGFAIDMLIKVGGEPLPAILTAGVGGVRQATR